MNLIRRVLAFLFRDPGPVPVCRRHYFVEQLTPCAECGRTSKLKPKPAGVERAAWVR